MSSSITSVSGRNRTTKITTLTPAFNALYDDLDIPDTALNYQVQVDYSWGEFSDPLYDSGKTSMTTTDEGDRTPDATYDGSDLYRDGTHYHWRLKLWDEGDNEGEWTNGDDYFYTEGDRALDLYYAYDRVGNVTQVIDDTGTPNGRNYVYTYDPLNRLTTPLVI